MPLELAALPSSWIDQQCECYQSNGEMENRERRRDESCDDYDDQSESRENLVDQHHALFLN